jgi:hypothetical protein
VAEPETNHNKDMKIYPPYSDFKPERKEFRSMLHQARKNKLPVDIYNVGCCYLNGWGTNRDPRKAAQFFREAAAAGISSAEINLGLMLLAGEGVDQDSHEGLRLIERAAQAGEAHAMSILSNIYLGNKVISGIEPDEKLGLTWLMKAVDLDNPQALHNLGVSYIAGCHGLDANIEEGLYWIRHAAMLGHDFALKLLADIKGKATPCKRRYQATEFLN